jgi:hypothetical protein
MYVHFGVEGTKSNGNGEEMDKDVGMMKIIKELKKYVQIYEVDNESIKRAIEQ